MRSQAEQPREEQEEVLHNSNKADAAAEGWPGQEGLSGPKTQGQQQMASKEPARSSESLSQPQFLRGSRAPAPG